MALDWIRLFERTGVDYVSQGANVARGHVSIHCPWCGAADPSHHMSVSLEGKGWRCYRNHEHRGKAPARLLQAAAGISLEEAHRLCGNTTFIPTDFMGAVRAALHPPSKRSDHKLIMPDEFKPFGVGRDSASVRPFIRYLLDRGFTRREIDRMTSDWDVRYATKGDQAGRVIFPVYHRGKLVSWTGRTIGRTSELRYKTLGVADDDDPRACGPISDYLLWHDVLSETDADTVVIVEGPFDALKVNHLGCRNGIVATCCFTAQPSEGQIFLLQPLMRKFKRRFIMLDKGTLPTAMRVIGRNPEMRIKAVETPSGYKDPGEFDDESSLLCALSLV